MQINLTAVSKRAVDAALQKDWDTAILLNESILDKNPNDKEAKIRLGRALIKTGKFTKAKKIFKEILEEDPINQIAIKNFKLATDKNPDRKGSVILVKSVKQLVKEPGTSTQIDLPKPKKQKMLDTIEPGEELVLRFYKASTVFFKDYGNKQEEIGKIEGDMARRLYKANSEGENISANIIKINGENLTLVINTDNPIFKAQKQHEKPYVKKGTIEEPELEMDTQEEDYSEEE